jgi:hypothetical protein
MTTIFSCRWLNASDLTFPAQYPVSTSNYCFSIFYSLITLLFIALFAFPVHGQTPEWQWAKQSIGSGKSQVKSIIIDGKGSTYVVGFFTEKIKLDTISLTSRGQSDLFVGKLSSTGNWEWAIAAGSSESDQATGITLDAKGQIFVTGGFSEQMQLGKTTLTSRGAIDIFTAQVSAEGQWVWATSAGGVDSDWPRTITANKAGNLLVAGQFAEVAFFGEKRVMSQGNSDAFVAQLTPAGGWQWVTTAGGTGNDVINATSTDQAGNLYVTGFFSSVAIFGTTHLTGQGMNDSFVSKLSSTGQWRWATAGSSSTTSYGLSLATDPTGGVYVTGSFNGQALFGAHHFDSSSGDDGFVARVTKDGKWDWVTTLSGEYLIGITSISPAKRGKLYVSGIFYSVVQAGSHQLVSKGEGDILLGILNRKGSWLSLSSAGDIGDDKMYSLGMSKRGEILIGGYHDSHLAVRASHFN